MCGRFAYYETEDIEERFHVTRKSGLHVGASYNVAPGQSVPVIHNVAGDVVIEGMRWGYLPSWANDERFGYKMINARDDSVEEKPAWRGGLRNGRCLVPANGFFEWKALKTGKGKQPYFIRLRGQSTFAMAGVSNVWLAPNGREIPTFAIITTAACSEMMAIHDRMPVIVSREEESSWLASDASVERLRSIMRPREWRLECIPVGRDVNSVRNNAPALIERHDTQ